jgi:hypothetical protein
MAGKRSNRYSFQLHWISITTGDWGAEKTVKGGAAVTIAAPAPGVWAVAIVKQ